MGTFSQAAPVAFIPALPCEEPLYREVIAVLGDAIEPHGLLSPGPRWKTTGARSVCAGRPRPGSACRRCRRWCCGASRDALVPVTVVGRALAAALPHARFEAIEGCGHLPTLETPRVGGKLRQIAQDGRRAFAVTPQRADVRSGRPPPT